MHRPIVFLRPAWPPTLHMKIIRIVGSLLLLVSFFLPWVDAMITTVSGFELPQAVSDLMDMTGDSGGAGILYLLYLIPVLAIITLIMSAMNKNVKIIGIVTGIVSLLMLIVIYVKGGETLSDSLQIGFYLTGISSLIVLGGSLAGNSSTESRNTV